MKFYSSALYYNKPIIFEYKTSIYLKSERQQSVEFNFKLLSPKYYVLHVHYKEHLFKLISFIMVTETHLFFMFLDKI